MRLILVIFLYITVLYASFVEDPNTNYDNITELLIRKEEIENYIYESPKAVAEDAFLKVPELLNKYGYPAETYTVTTSDGYILTMHRIPYGKSGPSENRPAVFLQHGLLSSSADWITPGPEKGFGYLLADQGYDVWMSNARGNYYSRSHIKLNPDTDREKFWDFSWHEIGVIDIPAMIDVVIETTNQQKIFYIGHSQGTTAFYVMCSERPEYNDKIRAQFSLAAAAYMKHMYSPLIQLIAKGEILIEPLLKLIGAHEFVPKDKFLHNVGKEICKGGIPQVICINSIFMVCGFNKAQMNKTLIPIMMGHTPAGAATKQLMHYAQGINSNEFRQYDYGIFNLFHYGSLLPPKYDLGKVTAPVYILYSTNDWLSNEIDVRRLYEELGNPRDIIKIEDTSWNHLDYVIGIDAITFVYNIVFNLMKNH